MIDGLCNRLEVAVRQCGQREISWSGIIIDTVTVDPDVQKPIFTSVTVIVEPNKKKQERERKKRSIKHIGTTVRVASVCSIVTEQFFSFSSSSFFDLSSSD